MIFFLFNQVIYSPAPISWPSFKSLAQILFKISCWQNFIVFFSKGHNSRKGETWTKKKKYRSAIFPLGIHIWNFKTLACMVHMIWHASDFVQIFSKGHNSRKGDNSDKKKNMCQLFFHEESIYMKFQNPSMHGSWWMDGLINPNHYAPSTSLQLGHKYL